MKRHHLRDENQKETYTHKKHSRFSDIRNDRLFGSKENIVNINSSAASLTTEIGVPQKRHNDDDGECWRRRYDRLKSQFDQLEKDKSASDAENAKLREKCGKKEQYISELKQKLANSSQKLVKNETAELRKSMSNRDVSYTKADIKPENKSPNRTLFHQTKLTGTLSRNNQDIEWCQDQLNSCESSEEFMKKYAEKFFTRVEFLLPLKELSEKMKAVKDNIEILQKLDIATAKNLHIKDLKDVLKNKRTKARNEEYQKCEETRSVAMASNGSRFYFKHCKSGDNWKWIPYADKYFENELSCIPESLSEYDVPKAYTRCEYIVIAQISPHTILTMCPRTGYTKCLSLKTIKRKN